MKKVSLTFTGSLQRVLPSKNRRGTDAITFEGSPSVKHLIESAGVPHTEVGEVLVNGKPCDLSYQVQDGDHIQVLPVSPKNPPEPDPLETADPRFVADTHLGKLAVYLRMLGFDTLYKTEFTDQALAEVSSREERILLTRDRGLLKRKQVTQGYCVVAEDPKQQIRDVLERYSLAAKAHPFQRCLRCNALLEVVDKETIAERIPPQSRQYYDEFRECPACHQIYWKGSHYQRMQRFISHLIPPSSFLQP